MTSSASRLFSVSAFQRAGALCHPVLTADAFGAIAVVSFGATLASTMLASVNLNETQANPFQPDVQFRGFVASPLLGLPQGLAVYQDGVRANEPFGDT